MDRERAFGVLDRLQRQPGSRRAVSVSVSAGERRVLDNRATQHIVSNDFLPARRVMERVTVVGDRPF
jgi:alpha-ketoglutarate-dependent taurine dioxygenase